MERAVTRGRGAPAPVFAWLLGLAAVAWALLASSASMSDMAMSFGEMPAAMGGPGIGAFMTMWITMMVAMMFPVVAPMVAAHRVATRARGEGAAPTVAFTGGYIAVWGAIGIVPASLFAALPALTDGLGTTAMGVTGGGLIALAGLYQLSGWKETCLKSCRHPLGFLMTHDFSSGSRGAMRAGFAHGAYCVGCCWGLMVVLAVVGIGNLAWMAALTTVFLLERNWRYGETLARVLAPTLVAFGVVVAGAALT